MLVSFQTAMPVLLALLVILTAWVLIERPVRSRVVPVFETGITTTRLSQPGQILRWIPSGQLRLREARRGSPDALPDACSGILPARVPRLL